MIQERTKEAPIPHNSDEVKGFAFVGFGLVSLKDTLWVGLGSGLRRDTGAGGVPWLIGIVFPTLMFGYMCCTYTVLNLRSRSLGSLDRSIPGIWRCKNSFILPYVLLPIYDATFGCAEVQHFLKQPPPRIPNTVQGFGVLQDIFHPKMEIRSSATTVFSPDVSTGLKDHEVVNEVMSEASVLQMADGMSIAFQEWYPVGRKDVSKKVLALHGWLDNSSSFSLVGPNLASKGFHFVAIDHVGHGESSHIGLDAQYSIPSYVSYVHAVIDQLGWQAPSIVAHSMGAFIGTLFAGCFPERVHKLVLIEGLVPLTAEASLTATNLRKSIESMHRFHLKASKLEGGKVNTAKTYLTFSAAVEARMKSVLMFPGKQTISADAVRSLVSR